MIQRKHAELSNRFTSWLSKTLDIAAVQERSYIDLQFKQRGLTFMVEFKIAYQGDTRRAIREALGQTLEYNLHANRIPQDRWLLVLDCLPSDADRNFIRQLRSVYDLPLTLGWVVDNTFKFDDPVLVA